jgi:GNAT superfamily N-acetyltransferase
MITYKETKSFSIAEIERLFLSVGWESGRYPEKIKQGLLNSSKVISAWDGNKLIGLVRGLDDGFTVGFLHYLLVDPDYHGEGIGKRLMEIILKYYKDLMYIKIIPSDPKVIKFYEQFGFRQYDNYSAMVIKNF